MNVSRTNTPVTEDGGAVDKRACAVGLMATGAAGSGVWSLASTVHTLVSAPLASLTTLGISAAAGGGGAYLYFTKPAEPASKQTVDAAAVPA